MKTVVFTLASQEYALEIKTVREIITLTDIVHIPQAPDYVKGVINLRGTVTPIVSLYQKFDIAENELSPETRIIIVSQNDKQIGVIVDGVTEVLDIHEEDIQETRMGLELEHEYIKGIGKLEDRMIIILNLDKLCNPVDFQ